MQFDMIVSKGVCQYCEEIEKVRRSGEFIVCLVVEGVYFRDNSWDEEWQGVEVYVVGKIYQIGDIV